MSDQWEAQEVLRGVKHLSFEVSSNCNLAEIHPRCPVLSQGRFPDTELGPLVAQDILRAITEAVSIGFEGYVGFHYYNEPLMDEPLIRIVIAASEYERFMLWTNGALLSEVPEENDILDLFEWVMITDYGLREDSERWLSDLRAAFPNVRIDMSPAAFDSRKDNYSAEMAGAVECWRQRLEVPIDHFGNVHLCCQDWKGTCSIGNIKRNSLVSILGSREYLDAIAALAEGCGEVPLVCHTCTNPMARSSYDSAVRDVFAAPEDRTPST